MLLTLAEFNLLYNSSSFIIFESYKKVHNLLYLFLKLFINFHSLDYLEANDSMLMGIMMRFRTLSATNQSLVQMLGDTSDQVRSFDTVLYLFIYSFRVVEVKSIILIVIIIAQLR